MLTYYELTDKQKEIALGKVMDKMNEEIEQSYKRNLDNDGLFFPDELVVKRGNKCIVDYAINMFMFEICNEDVIIIKKEE